jgi:tRNA(fMet)-specific endonuclease VapC
VAFLLDTNVIIDARDGVRPVLSRMLQCDGELLVSALSVAELQRGSIASQMEASVRTERLSRLLSNIRVVPFDRVAAETYGRIVAVCGWVRSRDFDRLIAGHALSLNATLVTNNERDFRDIPGLAIENWLSPTR